MATRTKTVSIHRYCVQKLGAHRGAMAAARVAQWVIVTAELGLLPSTGKYAEWWAIDERTGWRHRAIVHEVFGDQWPLIVERLAAEASRRAARSPRAVQKLRVAR